MALPNNFSVYDETWTNRLYYNDEYMFPTMTTVYSFLTANVPGVRYISKTIWWTPYSDDASMRDLYNDWAYTVYAIPFPKTIAWQIERLQYDKSRICAAIENKWVTVWSNLTLDDYAACILAIPSAPLPEPPELDFLLVAWGWWWGTSGCTWNWWWWAGWLIYCCCYCFSCPWEYPVVIWAGWASRTAWSNSEFNWIIAYGWWQWSNWPKSRWWCWWSWWGGGCQWWGYACAWQWHDWGWGAWYSSSSSWWWWGGWAGGVWWWGSRPWWWVWWCWCTLNITGENYTYASGWAGTACCGSSWTIQDWVNYWDGWWWGGCAWHAGVFILRYPTYCAHTITWWIKYRCNWYCIHCFTSDWTLTINR